MVKVHQKNDGFIEKTLFGQWPQISMLSIDEEKFQNIIQTMFDFFSLSMR